MSALWQGADAGESSTAATLVPLQIEQQVRPYKGS
jgi:hypothetical protein